MSGLLELLCQIERRDKVLGQSLRALLEIIAEMHEKDKAEIESLKALISDLTAGITMCRTDAEIGRLVRGMHDLARLRRDGETYWATLTGTVPVAATDPADALRSIQASK